MKKLATTLLALLASASVAQAQSVLIVDATGAAGVFLEIQDAIDAAADGDLVLVKSGAYGNVLVDGKSVVVAADAGATVHVGFTQVRNVPADGEVVLRGLVLDSISIVAFFALDVTNCEGHVLLQDMVVETGFVSTVAIRDSASVAIVDSFIRSVDSEAPAAVDATSSNLFIHRSEIEGAHGSTPLFPQIALTDGRPGLIVRGGSALIVDSIVRGGDGGDSGPINQGNNLAADGGPGLLLELGTEPPTVVAYGSTLAGGGPGISNFPPNSGVAGPPTLVLGGTLEEPAGTARGYQADAVVRVGDATTLAFEGEPFDLVWLLLGLDAEPALYLPSVLGALHPAGPPLVVRFLGLLDGNGAKDLNLTLSPTGVDYLPFYEQALMYDLAADAFVASNPRFVAFLASTVP